MGVFRWTPKLAFGLVEPNLCCLVPWLAPGARLHLAIRTPRARPRKKHRVGVSSRARPEPAPVLLLVTAWFRSVLLVLHTGRTVRPSSSALHARRDG